MPEPTADMEASRKLDRLTTAVWVLVAISTINLVLTLYGLLPSNTHKGATELSDVPHQPGVVDPYANFYEWPVDKQIQTASVIALAKHTIEKDQVKSVISEILKQTPGTTFYYKVGDEWGTHEPVRLNTSYGDGQVMFFVGSPAQFRFSTTYNGSRIAGLGDMPLEVLRKKIQETR